MATQSKQSNAGGQNPEFVLREFGGMNTISAREAIEDNDFYWCENLIPLAPGKLSPVPAPSAAIATVGGETGGPSYTTNFTVNGVDWAFAVWSATGNGYVINLQTSAVTKIFNGTLTSGQTAATQYSNRGLLIVDSAGYWDWNITTGSTLTSLINTVVGTTIVAPATITTGGTSLRLSLSVSGTGVTFTPLFSVNRATVTTAGTGYAVGDVLTLSDGSPITGAQIQVTAVGGGGSISTFVLLSGGSYPGPTSSTPVATGPAGATFTTQSAGTGAVFSISITHTSTKLTGVGTGYSSSDTGAIQYNPGAWTTLGTFTIQASGVTSGSTIATYAGRVWVGSGRTISFTDINSYNSFGGAGGSLTINDSYLRNNITALYSANNYLYIFGDANVDVLSNVTITNGVTAFSRINLVTGIGTSTPTSVFSYYRAVVFYHGTGFYSLSGATPEKVSEKINPIVTAINAGTPVYGEIVVVQGELCASMLFTFNDTFTGAGTRTLLACFFRNKWWVASFAGLTATSMFAIASAGQSVIHFWAGNSLYRAFSGNSLAAWTVQTKLWDGGAPLREKQSINIAMACHFNGSGGSAVSATVDTELASSAPYTLGYASAFTGYQITVAQANNGGGTYLGLTLTGTGSELSHIGLIAMRGKTERDLLQ